MEGSCEYIGRGQLKKGSPEAWGLEDVPTTLHRKNWLCYET
jgi:hypothetical protein